jgi:hypothetical protein
MTSSMVVSTTTGLDQCGDLLLGVTLTFFMRLLKPALMCSVRSCPLLCWLKPLLFPAKGK